MKNSLKTSGIAALTLIFAHIVHAQSYTVTDLGTLGSSYSSYTAVAINSSGMVVGWCTSADSSYNHAFSYSNGQMTDLGTLGGSTSFANGINDEGVIVGDSYTAGNADHAFSYSNGKMTDLGTLGGSSSQATGINNTGTIVGSSATTGDTTSHAFSYSNGVMTDLGTIGSLPSYATAINSTGTIAGYDYENPNWHALSYANGTITALGGTNNVANAINNAGTIVGNTYEDNQANDQAFNYSNGTMTAFGPLGGSATGINDAGTIVGYSTDTGHAFVYSNGQTTDLNSLVSLPGVTLTDAEGINANGQIAVNGNNGHAYLLTPIPIGSPVPAMPFWALATLILFLFCSTALFLPRKRHS